METKNSTNEFDRLINLTINPTKKAPSRILLGHNALNGKGVFLEEEDRDVHQHVLGSSGTGKSKLLELQLRNDIDSDRGLILIDPVGDLYDEILNYVAYYHLGHKVALIDPNDEDWAVGINPLEYDDSLRSSTSHASEVMKGIAKVFGGEELESMPQLQRWERNAIVALTEAKCTIVELSNFMRNASVRETILREVSNREVLAEWQGFGNLTKPTIESYSGAIFNRANKFTIGRNIRRIFGQEKSTVNFREAMDKGKIILCNLARKKISEEEQKMLGVVILDKIVQSALSRVDIPRAKRKPFYVYIDEFGMFVSYDIAIALWELRKFNVRFILAHQELEQLFYEDKRILSAVLNEPKVKIAFRTGRENAEAMMQEMFAGQIRGDKVKFDLYTDTEFHVEETRTVRTNSFVDSLNSHRGTSKNSGTTQMPASDWQQPEIDENITSFILSSSDIDGSGSGHAEISGTAVVPFLKPVRESQLSSRQFYSIEEVKEKLIAWLQTQPNRHAQCKIGTKKTIPIITPNVEPVIATEREILKVKLKSGTKNALPSKNVDLMLDERQDKYLEEARETGHIEEVEKYQDLSKIKLNSKMKRG